MKKTILTLSVSLVCLAAGFILISVGCARKNNNATVVITTWNVRGYHEKEQSSRQWFHQELTELKPDVFCVQEIANQVDINQFLSTEQRFTKVAFADSSDGQDNAIFCTSSIDMEDIPDPNGFQHPAQAAYVSYGGFDAVIQVIPKPSGVG